MNDDDVEIQERFFSGRELIGDDFNEAAIEEWFHDEEEGYANLPSSGTKDSQYGYTVLNQQHGFRHLPHRRFERILGIGSSFGEELLPITPPGAHVTILEPSSRLVGGRLSTIAQVDWIKPASSGQMEFPDGTFDLITCFGVLHHIPNVSYVLTEISRVLKDGGSALIREPIVSMGDWRKARTGLTKRERGIPLDILRTSIRQAGLRIERETICMFPLTPRIGKVFGASAYNNKVLVNVDYGLAQLTRPWYTYHAYTSRQKIRPTSAFYVLAK